MPPPQAGSVGAQAAVLRVNQRIGNADVGENGLAALQPSGQQQVPGLEATEGDRQPRLRRGAEHRARGPVHPGWHIDGDHGRAMALQRQGQLQRVTFQGAGKPGAEHGVDHQPGTGDGLDRGRLARTAP